VNANCRVRNLIIYFECRHFFQASQKYDLPESLLLACFNTLPFHSSLGSVLFLPFSLPHPEDPIGVDVFSLPSCLSVGLFLSGITQSVMDGFREIWKTYSFRNTEEMLTFWK